MRLWRCPEVLMNSDRNNVRNALAVLIAVSAVFVLFACSDSRYNNDPHVWPINFTKGTFPEAVTSFSGANSEFDDYNLAPPPTLLMEFPVSFSSNRSTSGGTFNVEGLNVFLGFDQTYGIFFLQGRALD